MHRGKPCSRSPSTGVLRSRPRSPEALQIRQPRRTRQGVLACQTCLQTAPPVCIVASTTAQCRERHLERPAPRSSTYEPGSPSASRCSTARSRVSWAPPPTQSSLEAPHAPSCLARDPETWGSAAGRNGPQRPDLGSARREARAVQTRDGVTECHVSHSRPLPRVSHVRRTTLRRAAARGSRCGRRWAMPRPLRRRDMADLHLTDSPVRIRWVPQVPGEHDT